MRIDTILVSHLQLNVVKRLASTSYTLSLPTLANIDDCHTSHLHPRVFRWTILKRMMLSQLKPIVPCPLLSNTLMRNDLLLDRFALLIVKAIHFLLSWRQMVDLAPLSLIDTLKTAIGQSFKDLNRLVRQAHLDASDKLHYLVISDPVFVSFADASWANRKDFGSHCGCFCIGTEVMVGRKCCSLLSCFLAHSQMSLSCTPIRFCRDTISHASIKKRANSFDLCFSQEIVHGGYDDTVIDQEFPRSEVVSSLTRKVFLMQFTEANPQLFPCKTKDRRWKVLL